ncbi:MAG: dihydrofolate reductase family protein [Bacteroidetes bacterium]|nr:dihydrofolate reductase family protein [Bacteroidota bacterium]
MSKVFFDCGISLDGFFAGDNRSPSNPMGGVSRQLHQWMFHQKAFWTHIKQEGCGDEEYGADSQLIDAVFARTGAYIMGKRMFEEGEALWAEDIFHADVFVLTHEKRAPWVQQGTTTFYFVNDGIQSALEQARQSARGKDIRIQGGADTIQQFLRAGLVEECFIHLAPVFLGSGVRLFEGMNSAQYEIQAGSIIPSELTTHLSYTLRKL